MEENEEGVNAIPEINSETCITTGGDQLHRGSNASNNNPNNTNKKKNKKRRCKTHRGDHNNNSDNNDNNNSNSGSTSSGSSISGNSENVENPETYLNSKNAPDGNRPPVCVDGPWRALELRLTASAVDWTHPVARNSHGAVFSGRDPTAGVEVLIGVEERRSTGEEKELKEEETEKEEEKEEKEVPVWLRDYCPGPVRLLKSFEVSGGDVRLVVTVVHRPGALETEAISAAGVDVHQEEEEEEKQQRQEEEKQQRQEEEKQQRHEEEKQQRQEEEKQQQGEEEKQQQGEEEKQQQGEEKHQEGEESQQQHRVRRENSWVIDAYIVNKNDVIGKGKFGTVYRGVHQKEGYGVAVKVLRGPPGKKEKLLTEARELNRLQMLEHPNIIRLFGVYRKLSKNEIALVHVLELCKGGDLKEFLARHDPLTERQARHIMRQLVDCLCALKENHTMHRDLKPANILLTSSNIDEAIVKVADWGMAKSSDCSDAAGSAQTGGNVANIMFESAVGTVAYMSPERLVRDFYDFQAEVWAAGVIMYELLFARHPYLHSTSPVRTPEELLNAITRAEELEMTGKLRHSASGVDDESKGDGQPSKTEKLSLSQHCYTLLRRMLDPNAKTRFTIEQVRQHPWFSLQETMETTTEMKNADTSGELKYTKKQETSTGAMTAATTITTTTTTTTTTTAMGGLTSEPIANPVGSIQLQTADDDTDNGNALNLSRNWGISQRQQAIYQAVRDHMHVLRHDVIEAEVDPGRRLVLLSYAWELLRAAVYAAILKEYPGGGVGIGSSIENTTMTDTLFNMSSNARFAFRLIPEDIRQMETYIQETAERVKRNLPDLIQRGLLGAPHMAFSTTSLSGGDETVGSSICPSPRLSKTRYPSAQSLLFTRALALIRTATTEEMILSANEEHDNYMEDEEIVYLQGGRSRRQHTYEQAMSILRLLLQQIVVRRGAFSVPSLTSTVPNTTGGGVTDTQDYGTLQVLTVPLLPPIEIADQRTVQALLHKVEKYYRRLLNVR
ncbi:tyrosine protein kinase [Trypanosoma theileri]|uniref:Tyrosine protein kinase n=1 Tax=Trypanosoma theileri TaxID=67003 RepID=A0A1X0NZ80_9TRYP|nr:tyrosine protein kinase [Trypanosoma theileri]ORC89450.1 tyrosine protein kinase [Trypanosoma theileri]